MDFLNENYQMKFMAYLHYINYHLSIFPGVVFLVVGDQTKKAELPNEITHLDTVRALFVRSFPGKLTMEYLASPKLKIYILDTMTNIYYQLEDLQ